MLFSEFITIFAFLKACFTLNSNTLNNRHLISLSGKIIEEQLYVQTRYSQTPNTADLGTGEKAAVFRKRQFWESYIKQLKNPCLGKWAAVLGGAVLRGTTVHILKLKVIIHRAQDTHKDPVCEAECGLYSLLCEDYCITCL